MADLPKPSGPRSELDAFGRTVFDLGGFQPQIEELPQIRAYLAEIQVAIQQLPGIDGIGDEIESDFDPTWPESES